MRKNISFFLLALMCLMGTSVRTMAQGIPEPSGLWNFNGADLMAADKGSLTMIPAVTGNKSITLTTLVEAGIVQTDGPTASNKAILVPAASALKVERPEGSEATTSYTILWDLKVLDAVSYDGLYQTNESNNNDGDLFIYKNKIGMNAMGGYFGEIKDDTWYRIVLTNSDGQVKVYVNGEKVLSHASEGRWEIDPWGFYLICDEDGEKVDTYVAKLAFWETPLTDEQTAQLADVNTDMGDVAGGIATAADLVAFAEAVNAGADIDGVLTADIDMAGVDFTPIGCEANLFTNTFDGQGHIISNLTVTKGVDVSGAMGGVANGYVGLFGAVSGGATIKNFTLKNAKLSGPAFIGIVGGSYGSGTVTIDAVGFEGEAIGTNQNVAGIIGVNMGSAANFQISNCYVTGKIAGGNESASISGWTGGGAVSNCWSTAEVSGVDGSNWMFRGGPASTNNYSNLGQGEALSDALLASGELTFKLNGNKADGVWYQTIGTDAYPVLTATSKKVYAQPTGGFRCDGLPLGDIAYSNDEISATLPDHEYDGFICKNCGQVNPNFIAPVNGVYNIGTAEELAWFAKTVNTGAKNLNAVLTADIDMSAYPSTEYNIGVNNDGYAGTFDGQFHTVKVAYVNNADGGTEVNHSTALFRFVNGGTVKNIITTGTIETNQKFASGLVGKTQGAGGTFENVETHVVINSSLSGDGTHAGFLGVADAAATITNAISGIIINGDGTNSCGGLCGWASAAVTFNNCLMIGEINCQNDGSATFSRNPGGNTYNNCYYKDGVKELQDNGNLTKVTADQLASGEVTYALNGADNGVFKQTLGQDANPTLNPESLDILKIGDGYSNPVAGDFTIASAEDLFAFAQAVNNGTGAKSNAVLTADIDLGGAEWTSIGSGNGYGKAAGIGDVTNVGYAGTFDGQGHTVSNFKIKDGVYGAEPEAIGLFGIVTGTVKNVGVIGADYTANKDCRAGGVAGAVVASSTSAGLVESCFVINSSIKTSSRVCGGVAGAVYGGTVKNCYAANNELTGYGERFGGVAGDTHSDNGWDGTVISCYTDHARVTSSQHGPVNDSEAGISAARFAGGEIAYKLGEPFRQTIGTDAYPIFDPTHAEVIKADDTHYVNIIDGKLEISSASDLVAYSGLINGGYDVNGILTADIDMNGVAIEPIGNTSRGYKNTFDGQGHVISNLTIDKPGIEYVGLFGVVNGGANISNFIVKNAKLNGQAFIGIVGGSNGSGTITLDKLGFEGEATGAAQNVSGIIGVNMSSAATFKISNCYVTGKVAGGRESAAITGWTGGGQSSLINCWSTAEVSGNDGGKPFYRNDATVWSNCYNLTGEQVTKIDAAAVASGELAYKLNGKQKEIVWTQTIGTDSHPVFDAKQVYVIASDGFTCDGTPQGNLTFTNDVQNPVLPDHEYDDDSYFCKNCGGINENYVTKRYGAYPLKTAKDLAWFVEFVNAGNTDANAELAADIDFSAYTDYKYMITNYSGTFDGLFHTVTLNYTGNSAECTNLFRYVNGATIRNLITDGTITTNQKFASGIAGKTQGAGGTFQNVATYVTINSNVSGDGTHAGILGVADAPATMVNVLSDVILNGANTTCCGGLVGWASQPVKFYNCLMVGEINVQDEGSATFSRNPGSNTYDNCYYKEGVKELQDNGKLTKVSAAQLASGEVTYKLGYPFVGGAWRQTLGADPNPVLYPKHGIVDVMGNGYVNKSVDAIEIASAESLKAFADEVNSGNFLLNGILTADIDLGGAEWISIGSGNGYGKAAGTADVTNIGFAGTFDGQGHTVSNFKIKDGVYGAEPEAIGLFGIVTGTVRNVGVIGAEYTANKDCRAGGVAGAVVASTASAGLVENCFVMNSSIKTSSRVCGGVAGAVYGGKVQNCFAAQNELTGYGERFGGVAGDTHSDNGWDGDVINCYTDHARVTSSQHGPVTNCQAGISAERFASGEIAELLGEPFHQTIGDDAYPVLDTTHGLVKRIDATGLATMYVPNTAVQVPSGVEAFAGVVDGNWVVLTTIGDFVPAAYAVVLKGAPGFYSFMPTDIDVNVPENELLGTVEPIATDGSQYTLVQKNGTIGYYKANGTIAAGKAYLYIPDNAGVKGYALNFGGETSIEAVENGQLTTDDAVIFDLSGRRVEKATKGLYIVNGKKVLVK